MKRQIDGYVGHGQPPRIARNIFHESLTNFVRTHDRDDILRSVAGTPSEEEITAELAIRDYVNQLRIIDLGENEEIRAVNDFLSASVDRTTWAEKGLISEESVETLETELATTWRHKQRRTRHRDGNKDEKIQGQLTYLDCIEHEARVDELETPKQFIRGSWHAMADDLTIGWHPQYKDVLAAFDSASKVPAEGI